MVRDKVGEMKDDGKGETPSILKENRASPSKKRAK